MIQANIESAKNVNYRLDNICFAKEREIEMERVEREWPQAMGNRGDVMKRGVWRMRTAVHQALF